MVFQEFDDLDSIRLNKEGQKVEEKQLESSEQLIKKEIVDKFKLNEVLTIDLN